MKQVDELHKQLEKTEESIYPEREWKKIQLELLTRIAVSLSGINESLRRLANTHGNNG
jgi:hypothetical protein